MLISGLVFIGWVFSSLVSVALSGSWIVVPVGYLVGTASQSAMRDPWTPVEDVLGVDTKKWVRMGCCCCSEGP